MSSLTICDYFLLYQVSRIFFLISVRSFKYERDPCKVDRARGTELLPVYYSERHMELWSVALGDILLWKYALSRNE